MARRCRKDGDFPLGQREGLWQKSARRFCHWFWMLQQNGCVSCGATGCSVDLKTEKSIEMEYFISSGCILGLNDWAFKQGFLRSRSALPLNVRERVNILLVDDEPAKLLSYEAILAEIGENLIKAHSGREALECLLKTDIALVLLDVFMSDINGFQLAEIIRQHPRFQDTTIIFISAVLLTDADRLKGYELGAVDYIPVPIISELLRARVKVFAELHRKTRQLETLNREMNDLSRGMIRLRDEEQRRIARELHDGLGQELSAAKMTIDALLRANQLPQVKEQAAELCVLIDSAIKQVRSISHLLHPPLLDEVGLHSALRSYVEGLTKRSGIETLIEIQPSDFPRLVPDLEIAIFRIVQEALTNVFRGLAGSWEPSRSQSAR